jgi:hypothetical protein
MGQVLRIRLSTASPSRRMKRLALAAFLLFSTVSVLSRAAVINVPADYSTIQAAISAASSGDEIIVSPGTYVENINFLGKNIVLRSTDPTSPTVVDATIINGNQAGSVVTFSGTESASCVLSGFTITNGRTQWGAGICGAGAFANVQHNKIMANSAIAGSSTMDGCGGGIAHCNGTLQYNTVSSNTAANWGGGIYGGTATIQFNTITNNTAAVCGGGLDTCNGIIRNNIISGNQTNDYGGGIHDCDGTIINNTISGNIAHYGGAGISSSDGAIINNTIAQNTLSSYAQAGIGVYNCWGFIANCIITQNTNIASLVQSQMYLSSTPIYSCIQDWSGGGIGNISSDPLFVDPANDDYHLQPASPCIDAGHYGYLFSDYLADIDGEARIAGASVDIGSDEWSSMPDRDGDFLSDADEAAIGTDAQNPDTDNDGLPDGIEVLRGTDPNVPTIPPGISVPLSCQTIQHAIFLAFPNESVTVSPGTYNEIIHFMGKNIVLASTNPQDPTVQNSTIINANRSNSVVTFLGSETSRCCLSGFTITQGEAGYEGAGILGKGTFATIEHNIITSNTITRGWDATRAYGAVQRCDGTIRFNITTDNRASGLAQCNGTIQDNIISQNNGFPGGALSDCNGTVENNIISNNGAGLGGGLYRCQGRILGNTITGNDASLGGALYLCSNIIDHNIIAYNMAGDGGALHWCTGTISNNVIFGNTAIHGAGLFDCAAVMTNNIIFANTAEDAGGGFYVLGEATGIVQNCTITENTAPSGGGAYYYYCTPTPVPTPTIPPFPGFAPSYQLPEQSLNSSSAIAATPPSNTENHLIYSSAAFKGFKNCIITTLSHLCGLCRMRYCE